MDALVKGRSIGTAQMHNVVVDESGGKIGKIRELGFEAGIYGTRLHAIQGKAATCHLPSYFADQSSVAEMMEDASSAKTIISHAFQFVRPYSGKFHCLIRGDATTVANELNLQGMSISVSDSNGLNKLTVKRGPLPGSDDWTHQYANAANSLVSDDSLVKAPLGVLWFGNGPSNDEVLPRHGHGPNPQVAAGRLVIEGPDMLRCTDIYTGRLLWQRQFPGIGEYHNNTAHHPGAGEIGTNYCTLADAVYAVYGENLLCLDAATGQTQHEWPVPGGGKGARWGFASGYDDFLVATASPVVPQGGVPRSGGGGAMRLPKTAKAVIKASANWKYHYENDPPSEWKNADFNDTQWKSGPAGFGYGDGDDVTNLDIRGKKLRVYIRNTFDRSDLGDAKSLLLSIDYDDAFIAYLNGQEIARGSVARGAGASASGIRPHEAGAAELYEIKDIQEKLRPGVNVLAVEGHNVGLGSSDFSLNPALYTKTGGDKDSTDEPPAPTLPDDFFAPVKYSSSSKRLIVMDRHSGKVLWQREGVYGFRHNNICMGDGKLFVIDGLSPGKRQALSRRGIPDDAYQPTLYALDVKTGAIIWRKKEPVFGTFLNYSKDYDILVQAGSAYRDRARDESGQGIAAFRGATGEIVWQDLSRPHAGPCLLHGDMLIAQGPAFSLLTGEQIVREHPLTGHGLTWGFHRQYGCNTAIAGKNLITFRSAAAGYCDMETVSTGNLGGFRSSCTSNLIVAGGLLNAPDYTRTCTCNYQNQTSLAFVHDPDAEMWTYNHFPWDGQPVRRVGLNFGAPGDRTDKNGTLWLEFPSGGSPSPNLPVAISPDPISYFCRHSAEVREPAKDTAAASEANRQHAKKWVAASGLIGVKRLAVTLAKDGVERNYTVRLHFAEPNPLKPGERVFDVLINGERVVEGLDVAAESGVLTPLVKEAPNVRVANDLVITFLKSKPESEHDVIISGIEVLIEE